MTGEQGLGLGREVGFVFLNCGRRIFQEQPGPVADDPVARPRRVAGIAQIHGFHGHAPSLGQFQQAAQGKTAAGAVAGNLFRRQGLDGPAGAPVDGPGTVVIEIMAEVRGHHDQRLRPAPQPVQDLRDLVRRGLADDEGQHLEIVEHRHQERQMHFQGMFLGMGRVEHLNLRQVGDQGSRFLVDFDGAQGRGEGVGARQGQAIHRDPVAGTQQNDSFDTPVRRPDPRIGAGRHGAGIDIARMGGDDRLGHGADGDPGIVPAMGEQGL